MNNKIDYFKIIHKYIKPESELYPIYIIHVVQVTAKALKIARQLGLSDESLQFIEEAAMLHDIGIVKTSAPDLKCFGKLPYICHGSEGRLILETENLPRHALVCDRHTGVGLSIDEIKLRNLPIPERDMRPETIEEEIICWSDLFFRKKPGLLWYELTVEEARANLAKFGEKQTKTFDLWLKKYGI